MDIKPVKCKYNSKVLCGIVKNVRNCGYVSERYCKRDNVINWLGMINSGLGTIILTEYRYSVYRIPFIILSENMCKECRVIWASPVEECPICSKE